MGIEVGKDTIILPREIVNNALDSVPTGKTSYSTCISLDQTILFGCVFLPSYHYLICDSKCLHCRRELSTQQVDTAIVTLEHYHIKIT